MLGIISPRENIKGEFAADILRQVSAMNSGVVTENEQATREFLSSTDDNITIEWN